MFIKDERPHLAINERQWRDRQNDESKTMSNDHILTRSLTVLFTGATAATLFLVAFAPTASLYAG